QSVHGISLNCCSAQAEKLPDVDMNSTANLTTATFSNIATSEASTSEPTTAVILILRRGIAHGRVEPARWANKPDPN
ncbi:MAG: hypothetical protein ACI8QF_004527, partial [Limisphaerales bacterium]